MLNRFVSALLGFTAIVLCYLFGEWLQPLLPIRLPAALIGLLTLFSLLLLIGKAPKSVDKASGPLLRHMSILFVPATLAVVKYADQLAEHALALFIALAVTTLLSLGFTALLASWMMGRRQNGN